MYNVHIEHETKDTTTNKALRSSQSKHLLHEKYHVKYDTMEADGGSTGKDWSQLREHCIQRTARRSVPRDGSGRTEVRRKGVGKIRDEARTVAIHLFIHYLC